MQGNGVGDSRYIQHILSFPPEEKKVPASGLRTKRRKQVDWHLAAEVATTRPSARSTARTVRILLELCQNNEIKLGTEDEGLLSSTVSLGFQRSTKGRPSRGTQGCGEHLRWTRDRNKWTGMARRGLSGCRGCHWRVTGGDGHGRISFRSAAMRLLGGCPA
jgi:hypothetical protein